jgi:prophage regulatory protein
MKTQINHNQIKEVLLRCHDVQGVTGLSRSGLYAAIKQGTFPVPVKIGLRAVAWRSGDISKWIADKGQGETR